MNPTWPAPVATGSGSTELLEAHLMGADPIYDPYTGVKLADKKPTYSPSQAAGLEAPRYCQICGRRMVVQVRPDGWVAKCSRHGELDSAMIDQYR